MDFKGIVAEIDGEISKLQHVRRLLAGNPSGSDKDSRKIGAVLESRKRKRVSPAARAKMSAAQKKRWAKAKSSKKA